MLTQLTSTSIVIIFNSSTSKPVNLIVICIRFQNRNTAQYSQQINDTRLHPERVPTGTNVITHNFLGTEFTAQLQHTERVIPLDTQQITVLCNVNQLH